MKKLKKNWEKICSILSIIISIMAVIISIKVYISDQESKPLAYYIKPEVTSLNNNSIKMQFEIMVTNGAVGNVRVLDYKDGEVFDIANNIGGTINEKSSKKERTFEFEGRYGNEEKEFIMTEYILIEGKDGSKNIGMVLYHVNLQSGEVASSYYSTQDLILAEMNSEQEKYALALNNYQELVDVLRERGEL